jgi:hypothetical protein
MDFQCSEGQISYRLARGRDPVRRAAGPFKARDGGVPPAPESGSDLQHVRVRLIDGEYGTRIQNVKALSEPTGLPSCQ